MTFRSLTVAAALSVFAPVWAGFGYQVNACPGDKVDVAATLIVSPTAPEGAIQISQTLPWHVDLSGLAKDEVDYLRQNCQADLPCVSHFQITVDKVAYPKIALSPGEWREGDQICRYSDRSWEVDWSHPHGFPPVKGCSSDHGAGEVIATLDGWD